ncbi:MAG: beta-phosphoglucomutase family hydrolase [Puniceicoccaceae bacterium]
MERLEESFDALVFDMDGTLADTMPTHFVAWNQTMNRYGIAFPEDRFYGLGGVPAPVIVNMLAQEQGVSLNADAVAHEKEELFVSLLTQVQPIQPVKTIAEAHRSRLPMAIATGSPRWLASTILSNLGIASWFEAVVTADDITHPKPAPDVFLEAARRLGVAPERCLAFEDTQLGMQSARDAGMQVIDVLTLL